MIPARALPSRKVEGGRRDGGRYFRCCRCLSRTPHRRRFVRGAAGKAVAPSTTMPVPRAASVHRVWPPGHRRRRHARLRRLDRSPPRHRRPPLPLPSPTIPTREGAATASPASRPKTSTPPVRSRPRIRRRRRDRRNGSRPSSAIPPPFPLLLLPRTIAWRSPKASARRSAKRWKETRLSTGPWDRRSAATAGCREGGR